MASGKSSALYFRLVPEMNASHARKIPATRAVSQALGALAIGAVAIGVLAVGAIAIARLAIGRVRIRRLEIDELVVGHLRVTEALQVPPAPDPED